MDSITKERKHQLSSTDGIPDGTTYHVTTKKETAKASDERAKRSVLIP